MDQKNEILDELTLIAPGLAVAAGVNPFSVPAGYFENLTGSIMAMIEAENALPKGIITPFTTPAGYFEGLSGSILATIAMEEDELAEMPLLHSISKQSVYTVPEGYFEHTIGAPSVEKAAEPAKVIGIRRYRRWVQYAAAAMVTGILISGAFLYTDSRSYLKEEKVIQHSAKTGEQILQESPAANQKEAMEETADVNPNVPKVATEKHTADFIKKIELISDDELKHYLEENAAPEPIQIIEDTTETEI